MTTAETAREKAHLCLLELEAISIALRRVVHAMRHATVSAAEMTAAAEELRGRRRELERKLRLAQECVDLVADDRSYQARGA